MDLWAYGVVIFELLAGYNPFESDNPTELYRNIKTAQINWPPYLNKTAKVDLVLESHHRNLSRNCWW